MFVANRMTKHPVLVASTTTVDEAIQLLKKNNIRRLPVVDDGKLVGIVTDKDLMRVTPSAATTLAKYEINSLLSGISVGEIMSKSVISVNESAPIEEAALLPQPGQRSSRYQRRRHSRRRHYRDGYFRRLCRYYGSRRRENSRYH